MDGERGQASIEWIALVTALALALGATLAVAPALDGRSLGGALAHRLVCAVERSCGRDDAALRAAYGARDAALVRRHLQDLVYEPGERQLPVDWRHCRAVRCALAADDRDLDAHRTAAGRRATVFARVVRRGARRYLEYWFYYPDSNTALAGSDRLWNDTPVGFLGGLVTGSDRYPGWHPDDWEGAIVRVDRDGRAAVRVTSHGHWQWCKRRACRGRWGPTVGQVRVSRGSHAGHVPDGPARERSSTADGIRLVPLEAIDRKRYRRLDPGIAPPWDKDAYRNPESPSS
jgi:hypothetical protein